MGKIAAKLLMPAILVFALVGCGSPYYAIDFNNIGAQRVNVERLQWGDLEAIPSGADISLSAIPAGRINRGLYGWRVGWQHPPLGKEHNPWMAEKLWVPRFEGQAAYILPPIGNIPDGPSGLVHYPGTGLDGRYNDHFFLCGFKGSAARSAISTWSLIESGASFRLQDEQNRRAAIPR